MVAVTNRGRVPEPFHVVGGKKGEPKFVDLRPGETQDLELADRHSPHNVGRERAGTITIADKAGKAAAATQASSPDQKGAAGAKPTP